MMWWLAACSPEPQVPDVVPAEVVNTEIAPAPEPPAVDWQPLYDGFRTGDPIPAFPLVDQDGAPFTLDRYDEDFVVLAFVFTRCGMPEACELTMARLATLQQAWLGTDVVDIELEMLVVTLDPDHDTPAELRAYRDRFGMLPEGLTLATGPRQLVSNALPSLVNIIALPRGPADISHTVRVVLLGPGRVPLESWPNNRFTADEVVTRVVAEASSG